jgi:hypothetical protein
MSRVSTYIVQAALNAKCPLCGQPVDMLCDHKGNIKKPWFFVCWTCRNITQIGVGPVTEER